MFLAFLISIPAFFMSWFFGTWTANLLGIHGPAAVGLGFVFALALVALLGYLISRATRPSGPATRHQAADIVRPPKRL